MDTSVLCVLVKHRRFFYFLSPGVVYYFIEFDGFLGKVLPLMIHDIRQRGIRITSVDIFPGQYNGLLLNATNHHEWWWR